MTKVVDYFSWLINLNNNMFFLKVCGNHRVLNITWRLLVLIDLQETMLYLTTNLFKISIVYTKIMVRVTTSNNSKTLLRMLWFLLLKDSHIIVPDIPWHQHQSRNQVVENHCVFTNILDLKKETDTCWVGATK